MVRVFVRRIVMSVRLFVSATIPQTRIGFRKGRRAESKFYSMFRASLRIHGAPVWPVKAFGILKPSY